MKRLALIILVFMTVSASAQHYVGVKGGWGAAKGRFYPVQNSAGESMESLTRFGKSTAGVMWKYYSPQQVVGGIGVELEFQQRGYALADADINKPEKNYTVQGRTVNTITMPLIWQPHLYLIRRHVRVFVSAGVTLNYNLDSGNTAFNETWQAGKMANRVTQPYTMQRARDVRWGYGWLGGAGVGVLIGRMEIFAEGRYYYGMSDLLRTKGKYIFNELGVIRSEMDNIYITMGVYWRLGKGGIKEAPLRRVRRPAQSESDFRNIKLPF